MADQKRMPLVEALEAFGRRSRPISQSRDTGLSGE